MGAKGLHERGVSDARALCRAGHALGERSSASFGEVAGEGVERPVTIVAGASGLAAIASGGAG